MKLLKEYVRTVLTEDFDDVISIIVRIRVKIRGPGTRNIRDIMTDIRGLVNVITVEQIGRISDTDTDGRSFVALDIKFEDDANYHVPDMLQDVSDIPDVDMIKFIKIDDHRRN